MKLTAHVGRLIRNRWDGNLGPVIKGLERWTTRFGVRNKIWKAHQQGYLLLKHISGNLVWWQYSWTGREEIGNQKESKILLLKQVWGLKACRNRDTEQTKILMEEWKRNQYQMATCWKRKNQRLIHTQIIGEIRSTHVCREQDWKGTW